VNRFEVAHGIATAVLLVAVCACSDVSRFDTGNDAAYCGTIVGATFVRQGFSRQVQAELRVDMDALDSIPAHVTFHRDGEPCDNQALFTNAPLTTPTKLESDPLSQLEFGDDRELNFLSWVRSNCEETYLAVVSLMRDDSVELRLLRAPSKEAAPDTGSLGVFPLERSVRGCGND
jgi:hypothetical protein